MRVYLLRHGRTAYNEDFRYQGWNDVPLSAAGESQLIQADVFPQAVWVSPLIRARRTAEILFPQARQTALEDLKEMNFGVFEGRSYREMEQDTAYRAWVDGGCEGRCPGGESRGEFCRRACGAFAGLLGKAEEAGEEMLVIVTHGGVQMAVMERFALPKRGYFDWCAPCGGGYVLEVCPDRRECSDWLELRETVCYTKGEEECWFSGP